MSATYYTSLTGMLAASLGLQNTSYNISNMQSAGFKRSDLFYSSLMNGKNSEFLGAGVKISAKTTDFSPGNYLASSSPSDLAIKGQGYFVIKQKNGELFYTRNGEFFFNQDGLLTDRHSGGLVQSSNAQNELLALQLDTDPHVGKATTAISLAGEFILVEKEKGEDNLDPDPFKSNYKNVSFSLENIFDSQGKAHKLELEFKPQGSISQQQKSWDALEWDLFSVRYDEKTIDFNSQTLKFSDQMNGSTLRENNRIELKINSQKIDLEFGDYMSDQDKSVRLNKSSPSKTNSTLSIFKQDGYAEGKQIGFSFDNNGQISYQYDNGQSRAGALIALAKFEDLEQNLTAINENLFACQSIRGRQMGTANKEGFGSIQPQKIESSNVDSTLEFANVIVLQRMFQSCSQIMDIDKQLLEELYKK